MMAPPVLSVENLTVMFPTYRGLVRAVNGISFVVERGEVFGLIGESGSGKSVTARSILRVLPNVNISGKIWFEGRDLLSETDPWMQRVRGRRIAMISQDPLSSLNPVFTIGDQLVDAAVWARMPVEERDGSAVVGGILGGSRRLRPAARQHVIDLLRKVHLPAPEALLSKYPHELSGGMRQRVLIAMAMIGGPDLLIADEPTTALDVSIQAQLLNLLRALVDSGEITIMYISHDLSVVAQLCNRVAVMYAGNLVEMATTSVLFRRPLHPYTRALLAALSPERIYQTETVRDDGLNLAVRTPGCSFAPRCPIAVPLCVEAPPRWLEFEPGHMVLCERTDRYDRIVIG
jgi:oligopeptide/dipeptide ABC transporter ATP-binding protein